MEGSSLESGCLLLATEHDDSPGTFSFLVCFFLLDQSPGNGGKLCCSKEAEYSFITIRLLQCNSDCIILMFYRVALVSYLLSLLAYNFHYSIWTLC